MVWVGLACVWCVVATVAMIWLWVRQGGAESERRSLKTDVIVLNTAQDGDHKRYERLHSEVTQNRSRLAVIESRIGLGDMLPRSSRPSRRGRSSYPGREREAIESKRTVHLPPTQDWAKR